MGCFGSSKSQKRRNHEHDTTQQPYTSPHQPQTLRSEELLLQIPTCKVHLIDESEAIELAFGDFNLIKVSDNNLTLAIIIRVGHNLQWPVIRDEPVVKLDARDYLFTLPVKNGDPLSYGVTFSGEDKDVVKSLKLLDEFLRENSCFSCSDSRKVENGNIDWKEFAPRIEDYNNVVAKAIAGGTGHIIRGIFSCSNAYTNQLHKGGEIMITKAEEKNGVPSQRNGGYYNGNSSSSYEKKTKINTNLQRARKLSNATEKLSKTMLNGAGVVSGSVMVPVMRSNPGKAFFSMGPGEILLASLDALNQILDATEAAERQTLQATSKAATRMVSERFGENAGEATEDVLATAGHAAGTAWNVMKIRKSFYPSSSLKSGIVKNVPRK